MLTDDHLRELGLLGVKAAAVENIVRVIANELVDENPEVGTALLGGLGFAQISDRIGPLLTARGVSQRGSQWIREGVSAAKRAMIKRNQLLHSHWITEDGPALQIRSQKGAPDYALEIDVEDIEDAVKALDTAWSNLRIGWALLILDFGRNADDPLESRPGMTTVPNRWRIASPPQPSPSKSKTSEQRWVEGKITWEEFQADR